MLEYRPKALDFMASVGLEQFNVRTSDVDHLALLEMLSDLVARGPYWSELIWQRMASFKKLQETRTRELVERAK